MPTQPSKTPSPPSPPAPFAYQLPVRPRTSNPSLRTGNGGPQTPPNQLAYPPMTGPATKKPSIENMRQPISGSQWVQTMRATSALESATRRPARAPQTRSSQYRFVTPPLPQVAPEGAGPQLPVVTSKSTELRPIQRAPTAPLGPAFDSGRDASPNGSESSYYSYSNGSTAVGTPAPTSIRSAPARLPPNSTPSSGNGRYNQPSTR